MVKDSIKVGSVQLKNRIVMPPIATYRSTEDGQITDDLLAYYGARAVGGCIGMIETEHSYICLQGKAKDRQLSIACDDKSSDGFGGIGPLVSTWRFSAWLCWTTFSSVDFFINTFVTPEWLSSSKILWIVGFLKSASIKRTFFSCCENTIAKFEAENDLPSPGRPDVMSNDLNGFSNDENSMFVLIVRYCSTIGVFG